jgi:hypothetical protein
LRIIIALLERIDAQLMAVVPYFAAERCCQQPFNLFTRRNGEAR